MISDNILTFVNENKDKTFILKNHGYEGYIVGFKNNLIIIEWKPTDGNAIFSEEYSFENLGKYIEIKKPVEMGDIVKIVDAGAIYHYYDTWFIEYDIPYDYALHYSYGGELNNEDLNSWYKVITIHKHLNLKNENLYLIQRTDEEIVYLIGEKGIKKC